MYGATLYDFADAVSRERVYEGEGGMPRQPSGPSAGPASRMDSPVGVDLLGQPLPGDDQEALEHIGRQVLQDQMAYFADRARLLQETFDDAMVRALSAALRQLEIDAKRRRSQLVNREGSQ